jgi:hypothetical protein
MPPLIFPDAERFSGSVIFLGIEFFGTKEKMSFLEV